MAAAALQPLPLLPDLAIEIISPKNPADEIADKLEESFKVGVGQVWVVYPRQRKVYMYRSATAVQILAPSAELDGGDVLPGFRLGVQDIFDKARQPLCLRSCRSTLEIPGS